MKAIKHEKSAINAFDCYPECATTALTIEKVSRCQPEDEKFDAIDFAQYVCFQGNLL
ncbi:AAEL010699-PA [Aedes aegypti]|uniref:AAEL010699-PA n=1 Tax=Aedes aegypti TaxID=7159 RepID=Q16S55_AEDAE|nr:AAEL010699-PA [Aedes aegypti]